MAIPKSAPQSFSPERQEHSRLPARRVTFSPSEVPPLERPEHSGPLSAPQSNPSSEGPVHSGQAETVDPSSARPVHSGQDGGMLENT